LPKLHHRLLLTQPLLSALLSFVGGVGIVQGSLEASSDIVGVLVSAGGRNSVGVTTVLDFLEHLLGVLLGLVGSVSKLSVSMANDKEMQTY
jgi:hypothetical protein